VNHENLANNCRNTVNAGTIQLTRTHPNARPANLALVTREEIMPKRSKQNPYQNTGETDKPLVKTYNTMKNRRAQLDAAIDGPKKPKDTPIYEYKY